jgi:hypothetical protein
MPVCIAGMHVEGTALVAYLKIGKAEMMLFLA